MSQRRFQKHEEDDPKPGLWGTLAAAATIGAALAVGYAYATRRTPDEDIVGDEQAIQADNYGQLESNLSDFERNERLRKYYQQAPQPGSIKKDDGTEWSEPTWERFSRKFNGPTRPQLTQEEEECLTWQTYEEVRLLSRFNFTGVILWNRGTQGLLHTFARHHDQWVQFVPGIGHLLSQLPGDVVISLDDVQKAGRRSDMRKLYNQLERAIKQSANETDTRTILMRIQFQILNYLREAVHGTYIGDYVNDGGVRHLFQVESPGWEPYLIAVTTSDGLDMDSGRFSGRPFRAIITAFFVKKRELESPSFMQPQTASEEPADCRVM